jgi:hypothetical protein
MINIRHIEPADYAGIILVVDDWWGARLMRALLPQMFSLLNARPSCAHEYRCHVGLCQD